MSFFTSLLLLVVIGAVALIIRAIVKVYRRTIRSPQPKFPTFSIVMLSISLVCLIVGTFISIQVSDAYGGAVASFGGFFGLFESHVRHKREVLEEKVPTE